MLEGKNGELPARVCDVRDVAQAHIRAMEDDSITGRIIVSQPNNVPSSDILAILKKRFPQYKLQDGASGSSEHIIDNSKVRRTTPCQLPPRVEHLQAQHTQGMCCYCIEAVAVS